MIFGTHWFSLTNHECLVIALRIVKNLKFGSNSFECNEFLFSLFTTNVSSLEKIEVYRTILSKFVGKAPLKLVTWFKFIIDRTLLIAKLHNPI